MASERGMRGSVFRECRGAEGHAAVGDTGLLEGVGIEGPAEAGVEAQGGVSGVAEDLGEAEFAEGAAFDGDDELGADALAVALAVDGHLHELAGAGLWVVGEEEGGADNARAAGVVEDGNEVLEVLLVVAAFGEHGAEGGGVEADGAEEDVFAQGDLLREKRVGGGDSPDLDHGGGG